MIFKWWRKKAQSGRQSHLWACQPALYEKFAGNILGEQASSQHPSRSGSRLSSYFWVPACVPALASLSDGLEPGRCSKPPLDCSWPVLLRAPEKQSRAEIHIVFTIIDHFIALI